jgi:hypothetical protein
LAWATDDELLEDIRLLAKKLGRQPTQTDYREHGKYGHSLPRNRFGSWPNAIKAAGLLYRYQGPTPRPTTTVILEDVRRLQRELGRLPTAVEYRQQGKHNVETVMRRALCKHWWQVLVQVCGATEEEAKKALGGGGRYRTTEERVAEVRKLAIKLRRAPTLAEAQAAGIDTSKLIKRTGKWTTACAMAGFPKKGPQKKAKPIRLAQTTDALGEVKDDVRDFLKDAPLDAVKEFFSKKRK